MLFEALELFLCYLGYQSCSHVILGIGFALMLLYVLDLLSCYLMYQSCSFVILGIRLASMLFQILVLLQRYFNQQCCSYFILSIRILLTLFQVVELLLCIFMYYSWHLDQSSFIYNISVLSLENVFHIFSGFNLLSFFFSN